MLKKFENAEIEAIIFSSEDVIATSSNVENGNLQEGKGNSIDNSVNAFFNN